MTSGLLRWGSTAALGVAVATLAVYADRQECRAGLGLPTYSCRWPALHEPLGVTDPIRQLRWHPLDGTVYRRLAESGAGGDIAANASPLWAIAFRRAPRDPTLAEADMHHALAAGDLSRAAAALDRRLRLDPGASPTVLEAWFEATDAGAPDPAAALGTLLVRDPPWRPWLMEALVGGSAAVPVLEAAQSAGAELTPGELEVLVTALVDAGDPVGARQRWRSSLSAPAAAADDGRIFDGDFSGVAAPRPFSWEIGQAPGVSVSVESGLVVSFAGRPADFTGVSQELALDPGRYRLQSEWTSVLLGTRPVAWVLSCVSSGAEMARIPIFPGPGTTAQGATVFSVPPACPRQRLQLIAIARSPAHRPLEGDLRVRRVWLNPADSREIDDPGGKS